MTHDPMDSPHGSREARYVFSYLDRRGGSVRLRPLLRGLAIDPRIFIEAVNELNQRYWITIIWHKPRPARRTTNRAPSPTSTASAPPASAAANTARVGPRFDVPRAVATSIKHVSEAMFTPDLADVEGLQFPAPHHRTSPSYARTIERVQRLA